MQRLSFWSIATLAVGVLLSSNAFAQQPVAPGLPPAAATNANPEWQSKLEDRVERREFREEAEEIREEHEDLEGEHDRLKLQCMNVKGQDRTACHERAEDLRQRAEALHERMRNLHERMQAERSRATATDVNQPGPWRASHAPDATQLPAANTPDNHPVPPTSLPPVKSAP